LLWVFCFRRAVKWKATSLVPGLICASVVASACLIEWLGETQPFFTFFQRLEWITYDLRVRQAAKHSPPVAENLGFVAIDDNSIDALLNGSLPYEYGLLWPRQVYARLVDELAAQGAKAVGFDVLFADLRKDHPDAEINGQKIPSDEFFAQSLRRGSNVILGSMSGLFPHPLFATNALTVAQISAERENDGILRRSHAFLDLRVWDPAIKSAAGRFGWKLDEFRTEPNQLLFPRIGDGETNALPLNANGEFDAGALEQAVSGRENQKVVRRFERPFQDKVVWHLGLVLAANQLGLNLNRAELDLKHGRIVLRNAQGVQRVIPVDREGRFLIDWSLALNDSRLTREAIENLLEQYESRRAGNMADVSNRFTGKLVVIGSVATGNNLNDYGATSLEKKTFLTSAYWNAANSLLMNRFVRSLDLRSRLLIIALLGALAGVCTWKLRTLTAVSSVIGVAVAYIALACWLFTDSRIWLPIVTPVCVSMLVTHVSLITYLVRVERRGRQRTKEIFSRVVSPDIVRELLEVEKLKLGGARRNVTVLFADIRGFTAVTDASQKRAELMVDSQKLSGDDAAEYLDSEAAAVLNTVNPYLGIVADGIKKQAGTLDKYIGDCVMAFWGAPVANPRHAVSCVRAAIEIQRGIFEFNRERQAENDRRQEENLRRLSVGENPLPMLELLTLGSGINTGVVTVGMVGSEAHLMNYTIFGREVNLASRLESASGRARILISENTYREILRDDPELAATARAQEPLTLKGFSDSIKAYEVPWRPANISHVDAGQSRTMVRGHDAGD
jgi:adenylate cyclase